MYDQEQNLVREDEEMEIEPITGGNPAQFSYSKVQKMLQSSKWS